MSVEIKNIMADLFNQFSSTYKQKKFIKEQDMYVAPIPVVLGKTLFTSSVLSKLKLEKKLYKGYYVLFEKSLNTMLRLPEVQEQLINKSQSIKNFKDDIFDGSYLENEKHKLLITLYYDDLEYVNCIGSGRKKHKTG